LEGEKPTGSGDPFGLRRAALGVIRIILERQYRVSLFPVLETASFNHLLYRDRFRDPEATDFVRTVIRAYRNPDIKLSFSQGAVQVLQHSIQEFANQAYGRSIPELISFLADRLKIALKESGVRHDLIDAVFALGNEDDLVRLVRRVEALQAFLKTDDGSNLLTGYRRAANILRIEEKKDGKPYRGVPDGLRQEEEQELQAALVRTKVGAAKALSREDFAGAMSALADLRVPVDRFFDKVTVNTDDKLLRENRLKLLSQIVETAHQVADFSKIEG
jgi:glycyl-tRNA synthetase beta chain